MLKIDIAIMVLILAAGFVLVSITQKDIQSVSDIKISVPSFLPAPETKIINVKLCNTEPDKFGQCDESKTRNGQDVWLWWKTYKGPGCCATFNCDYDKFYNACIKDDKLYKLYFDEAKIPRDKEASYICEEAIPWNWQYFPDVAYGNHTIVIEDSNCSDTVVTRKTVNFLLTPTSISYEVK